MECEYLAERIDKSFDKFYIELSEIDKIELELWTEVDIPDIKTELADIFEAELGIISADSKGNDVVVACDQDDKNFDYDGGNLSINCSYIKIFDQLKKEITVDQLLEICKNYWDGLTSDKESI